MTSIIQVFIRPLAYENLKESINTLREVFPEWEDASEVFQNSLQNDPNETFYRYWVIKSYDAREVIGTTGLYYDDDTPDDLWLGWYCIHPGYRRLGFGNWLLDFSIEQAKLRHAQNLRLWTTDEPSMEASSKLYSKKGFVLESSSKYTGDYKKLDYKLRLK